MTFVVPCPVCKRLIQARTQIVLLQVAQAHVERCRDRQDRAAAKAAIAAAQPSLFGGGS